MATAKGGRMKFNLESGHTFTITPNGNNFTLSTSYSEVQIKEDSKVFVHAALKGMMLLSWEQICAATPQPRETSLKIFDMTAAALVRRYGGGVEENKDAEWRHSRAEEDDYQENMGDKDAVI